MDNVVNITPAAPAAAPIVLAGVGRIFTYDEAAGVLKISRTKLFELLKKGELRPFGADKSKRLSEEELVRYARSSQAG